MNRLHQHLARYRPILFAGLPFVIYLCGLLYFLADINSLDSFPLDDAWIHRVYARSFAFGHGFEYNPGAQEAGATSPLWAIITAPAHWLHPFGFLTVTLAVKTIGILLGGCALWCLQIMTHDLTDSPAAACAATTLFALEPRFLVSALSGMETILFIALWLAACACIVRQRWQLAAILMSLMPVTRPESVLLLVLWTGGVFWWLRASSLLKRAILSSAIWLPFASWSVFCYAVNGHLLPNTFYIKSNTAYLRTSAITILWPILRECGYSAVLIFPVGILGYLFLTVFRAKARMLGVFSVAGPAAYLLGVSGTRRLIPGFYYWTRWTDPGILALTAVACMGFAAWCCAALPIRRALPGLFGKLAGRSGRLSIGLIMLGLCLPALLSSFQTRRNHFISDSRALYRINIRAALWIAEHVPPEARIGVNDAGAIRYFGNRYTVDLLGLNNHEIAFGRKNFADVLSDLDWLAIFPQWFAEYTDIIDEHFAVQQVFTIPFEEYTICNCPGQNIKAISKKKADSRL